MFACSRLNRSSPWQYEYSFSVIACLAMTSSSASAIGVREGRCAREERVDVAGEPATVDDELAAGAVARFVRREEEHHRRDLDGIGRARQGELLVGHVVDVLRDVADHRCEHASGV